LDWSRQQKTQFCQQVCQLTELKQTAWEPTYFGMVQFEGGGRLMSDLTDIDPDVELEVGISMRMVFRVKDYDRLRGFRRYFWKATPQNDTH